MTATDEPQGRAVISTRRLAQAGAALAISAATLGFSSAANAAVYPPLPPLPPAPVPSTVAQQPPPPVNPPPVTLPRTGSNGVSSMSMSAATLAAAGVGLVFVARRRREATDS